jgi:hypothetical protein
LAVAAIRFAEIKRKISVKEEVPMSDDIISVEHVTML